MSFVRLFTSNQQRVAEEDIMCAICLQTAKDPVGPASGFFWNIGSKAVCVHFFCKSCFEGMRSTTCPLCRAPFTKHVSKSYEAKKIEVYVKQNYGISLHEYFELGRLAKPVFRTVEILIKCGKYAEALELIKNLPGQEEIKRGYMYFLSHCISEKKIRDLSANFDLFPQELKIEAAKLLVSKFFQQEKNMDIFSSASPCYSDLGDFSFSLLLFIALYLVDKANLSTVEDLKTARNISEYIFSKDRSEAVKRDQIISFVAQKYYILGFYREAEEGFYAVSHPQIFAKDVFFLLFEEHLKKGEIAQAQDLLQRMGSGWTDPRMGIIRQLRFGGVSNKTKKILGLSVIVALLLTFNVFACNYFSWQKLCNK